MKALSIKQPWASLIAHGVKDIENRTWQTSYRGRIYIHASRQQAFPHLSELTPQMMIALDGRDVREDWYFFTSAIIGEVDIVDCVINHCSVWAEKSPGYDSNIKAFWGEANWRCDKDKPIYNWVLANPVLYDEPILNVKGKLSLWEYQL